MDETIFILIPMGKKTKDTLPNSLLQDINRMQQITLLPRLEKNDFHSKNQLINEFFKKSRFI